MVHEQLVSCQLVWQGPTFDMLNIAATLFPLLSLHLVAKGGQVQGKEGV